MNTYCELCGSVEHENDTVDVCKELAAKDRLLAEQAAVIDKMRIIFNNRIDKGDCQNCLAGVDAVPSPDGNWSYWYHRGLGDVVLCSNSEWRSFLYVLALPASPPSPAPVDPRARTKENSCAECVRLAQVDSNWTKEGHGEMWHASGLVGQNGTRCSMPAPVGRWDHCGHHDCDCAPAPVVVCQCSTSDGKCQHTTPAAVASKPKPFHECGPECYATPPAADTAKPGDATDGGRGRL